MKGFILGLCLCFVSANVLAADIDTSGLSAEQKAQIALQVEQMKNSSLPPSAESAKEWADWGTNMGRAISSTAKELGVAVDEFSRTSVGKITMAVIVYKVIGKEVLRFVAGGVLFFFTIIIWARYLRKPFQTIEYYENGKVKSRTNRPPQNDTEMAIYWVHNWATLLLGIAMSFVIAFV